MSENEKKEKLADAIDWDADDINAEDDLESCAWWDSLTRLSLIVFLEEECGKTVTTELLNSFKKVSDIFDMME
jgi:acyl carrier protein